MPGILEGKIKDLEEKILKKFAWVGEMSFKHCGELSEEFLDKECTSIKSMKEELETLKSQAKQIEAVNGIERRQTLWQDFLKM